MYTEELRQLQKADSYFFEIPSKPVLRLISQKTTRQETVALDLEADDSQKETELNKSTHSTDWTVVTKTEPNWLFNGLSEHILFCNMTDYAIRIYCL